MKNILVFPCGSEIALEIHRSLVHSTHFHLIGANSIDDHGRFVYDDYIGGVPFITDENFLPFIQEIIASRHVDAIYPALDTVMMHLSSVRSQLGCPLIAPSDETVQLCSSKRQTYNRLGEIISVPKEFKTTEDITTYPVFGKHDVGYGSIGTKRLDNAQMVTDYKANNPGSLICDYLPGDEYTVDCFSNSKGVLLFHGVRVRARVKNGISVRTLPYDDVNDEFSPLIDAINAHVAFQGAWFAQFKRNSQGQLVLLEIAARLGGSSALFRACGVNFAQLTLFDAFGYDVSIISNRYAVEMDRALDNVFKMDIHYSEVYVDFDDCLSIGRKNVNTTLVAFLYQCINENVRLSLLTHHDYDIHESLAKLRLTNVFDRIIHIDRTKKKADYVDNKDCIFIDDSYAERAEMAQIGVPVFSVDMIPMLVK